MFSFVQNIVSALEPVKTEAVDARFEKGGGQTNVFQDTEDDRSYDHDHKDSALFNIGEAQTNSFSINSLIYFLEDFLEASLSSDIDRSSKDQHINKISTIKPWLKPAHNNNINRQNSISENDHFYASQAAHAYADRALSTQRLQRRQEREINTDKRNNLSGIYNLIRDLRALKKSGVTHLNILDDATFLDGVNSAINISKE